MSFTRAQGRALLYDLDMPAGLGWARDADAILPNGIQDGAVFQDAGRGLGDYVGYYQYLPLETGSNRIKRGDLIDGDTWTHSQSNYSGTTHIAYEALAYFHPDILNGLLENSLRHIHYQYYWPVGWAKDNDFSGTDESVPYDWDATKVNMTTVAKITTGGSYDQAGQSGPKNLLLSGSAAGNGYVVGSRLNVTPGRQLFHGAIGRVNGAYTGSYVLYDVTNGAALETLTFSDRVFQRVWKVTTIPAGCRQVEQRIGNVTASGVTEWDCLLGHIVADTEVILPSWLERRYQFVSIHGAEYLFASDANQDDATTRRLRGWYPGVDYEPVPGTADATMNRLEIRRGQGLPTYDMWVQARRQWSSSSDWSTETGTTQALQDPLVATMQYEMFKCLYGEDDPRTRAKWATLTMERLVDTPSDPKREQPVLRIGMGTPGYRRHIGYRP